MNEIARLALGTVQLGMDYGIANVHGKPDIEEATAMIECAWNAGIREFDTAQTYGQSEKTLGRIFDKLGIADQALVVTKLAGSYPPDTDLAPLVLPSIERIGVPALSGIMLHDEEELETWQNGLGRSCELLRESGLVRTFGISVYSPEVALKALETNGIDMVQIPTNVLDQRFEKAGVFNLADKLGKTIYIRSVFLQGLFFIDFEKLEEREAIKYLDREMAAELIAMVRGFAMRAKMSIQAFVLAYIRQTYANAKVLIGTETVEQIRDNIQCWQQAIPDNILSACREEFTNVDPRIVHSPYWRRGSASLPKE